MYFSDKPRIRKVFLYLRKSTRDEDEKQIRSLIDQRADCETLAEKLGLTIVEVFEEDRSARRPHNRPEFRRMLKELSYRSEERRRADGVLAWHPDRLSRNALEAGMVLQMIDDELIKDLFFPAYSFHNDISGVEHLTNEFARAKGYTDRLSHVVMRGVQNREKEGAMLYPVKFGYRKRRESDNPAKCSLFPEPHPQHFPVIQRIFDLALDGVGIDGIAERIKSEYAHLQPLPLKRAAIDRHLKDSFYYGVWRIRPGSKDERNIDLRKIRLPDGTMFEPAISVEAFHRLHKQRSWKHVPIDPKRRRANPFPGLVYCDHCGSRMYPAYRKIRRAAGEREEQLGFECQHRHDDGAKCPQRRIKAEVLVDSVNGELADRTGRIGKREYYCWLLAANRFIAAKRTEAKRSAARRSRTKRKLEEEKRRLVAEKSALVSAGEYDQAAKDCIGERIEQIQSALVKANSEPSGDVAACDRKALTLTRFLELFAKLHDDWRDADFTKKGAIAQKMLLNLKVREAGVCFVRWKTPFADYDECTISSGGGPVGTGLESWFERLWSGIGEDEQTTELQEFVEVCDASFDRAKAKSVVSGRNGQTS